MPSSFDEWSDQHWDRSFARHSAQADAAKLVVTFSTGISGALVGTALQVTPQNNFDLAASIILGCSFIIALVTVFLDRLEWLDRPKLEAMKSAPLNWSEALLLPYIQSVSQDTENSNERIVAKIRSWAFFQLLVAGAAGVLAVMSLFQIEAVS